MFIKEFDIKGHPGFTFIATTNKEDSLLHYLAELFKRACSIEEKDIPPIDISKPEYRF